MQQKSTTFQSRYRNWLACFGDKGLSFATILERIWRFTGPEGKTMNDEDLNYLVCFVDRANKPK